MPEENKRQADPEAELTLRVLGSFDTPERRQWLQKRKTDAQVSRGLQWSPEDAKGLEERGQVDLVTNRLGAMTRHFKSKLSGQTPEAVIVPTGNVEYSPIALLNNMMKYILYISPWGPHYRRGIDDVLNEGLGNIGGYIDKYSSDGKGDFKFMHIDNQHMYWDSSANMPNFEDSTCVIIAKPIPLGQALATYPDHEKEILDNRYHHDTSEYIQAYNVGEGGRSEEIGPVQPGYNAAPRVLIAQRFVKLKVHEKHVYRSDYGELEYFKAPHDYEPTKNEIAIGSVSEQMKIVTSLGDYLLGVENEKVKNYPIATFLYDDVRNPYPHSFVADFSGQQLLLNKMYNLTLLILQQVANPRMFVAKNKASPNVSAWRRDLAKPNAIFEYDDMGIPGYVPYKIEMPGNVPTAFFNLINMVKDDIQYGAGSFTAHQGGSAGLPSTLGATQMVMGEADERMTPLVQNVDAGIEMIYRIGLEWMPIVYNAPRMVELFVNEKGNTQKVILNEPVFDQAKQAWTVLNDMSKVETLVRVRTGSSVIPPHTQMANTFMALSQKDPTLFKYVVQNMTELPNREEVLAEINLMPKLQGELKQLQESKQKMDQTIQNLEAELRSSKDTLETEKTKGKLNAAANRTRREMEVEAAKFAASLEAILKGVQSARASKD